MRKRIAIGFTLGLIYITFVLLVPHNTPRRNGLETDLTMMYINGAAALDNVIADRSSTVQAGLLWPDVNPFKAHGIGYPLVLWLASWPFADPVPAWSYFTAAKLVSVLSAVAVIVLTIVWLGRLPGAIAVISLATSPLFFRLSYSGCTDLFVAALLLWTAYCLFRRRFMVGGFLYALAIISRYEYLILLPFAAWLILRQPFEVESPATAGKTKLTAAGRQLYLMLAGRKFANFFVPVLILSAANLFIAGVPTSNRTNLAIHYLEEVQLSYQFTPTVQEQYPNYWSILSADPGRTFNLFTRGLGKTTANIVTGQVGPVLFVAAAFCLFRRRGDNGTWIPFAALAVHYLALNFFMDHIENSRFFILEIIALTFLGSSMFKYVNRWYLLALLPFFLFGSYQVNREMDNQIRLNVDGYLALRDKLTADKTIISMRPGLAFVTGTSWRLWQPGIKDIHQYCLENHIDYLHWTGQEAFHRREFGAKFRSTQAASPEFSTIHADTNSGVLFRVNP